MSIVTMTSEEIRRIVTPERIEREIEEAKKLPFVYDPDCPPLTSEQLKNFHRVRPRHTAG
ncbi:MAG: hypothetical protein IJ631_01185 [Schwartzia sp.]|nr:hypothetical protein [Schwartzia sp. (in: firmicutes)]